MADTITLTHKQLQQLLSRFRRELESNGGDLSDAQIEQVTQRLLDSLDDSCNVTGSERIMNSNVNIRLG